VIVLPFPPSSLSGHNNGAWHGKSALVKRHRDDAHVLTKAARVKVPAKGDIVIRIRFVPPNDRGDRVNYPIRIKPQLDGIAQALGVNDKRFLPIYEFAAPESPGRVEVSFPEVIPTLAGEQDENRFRETLDSAMKKEWPGGASNTPSRDQLASKERS